jgi:hypothetical protein
LPSLKELSLYTAIRSGWGLSICTIRTIRTSRTSLELPLSSNIKVFKSSWGRELGLALKKIGPQKHQ